MQLWIDFKLYFYVSNHKPTLNFQYPTTVVNWFQIVFLREQSQATIKGVFVDTRCELISNCIFTWAITRTASIIPIGVALWIDFKLYFYVSNHKWNIARHNLSIVVNWFQIVFLREQSQVTLEDIRTLTCCELISNCIFTWAITSDDLKASQSELLWIDFKLYFYVSNHK